MVSPPQPTHRGSLRRSADIALVAGGNRKRWIIATENMQPGDIIKNSSHIGRMAGAHWAGEDSPALPGSCQLLLNQCICFCFPVSANEGDAYPLGALPVGTLICNLESHPGKGAQYIRAAGVSLGKGPTVGSQFWLRADGEDGRGTLLCLASDRELLSSLLPVL